MRVALLFVLTLSACESLPPASIVATTATEQGIVPQSAKIVGHDGAASALIYGHSVWLYGDTPLSLADAAGQNWHSNSFAYTDDLDPSQPLTGFQERLDSAGAPIPIIANTDDEAAFIASHYGNPCQVTPCGARWALWPGAPVVDTAGNRALIPYGLIYAEPGSFNFHGVGSSLAVWDDFASLPTRPILSPNATYPTMLFNENEPGYGAAIAVDGDDLYTFACDPSGFDRPCKVGKAPLASALDHSAYTFWNGSAWSANENDAATIFEGGLGVGFFQLSQTWVALYARNLSNDIVARTATALTGPWSEETLLFTAQRSDGGWTYDPYEHSELAPADGTAIYVSYTRGAGTNPFGSETVLMRIGLMAK